MEKARFLKETCMARAFAALIIRGDQAKGGGNDPRQDKPVGRQLERPLDSGTLTGWSDAQLLGRFAGAGTRRPNPLFGS